MEEPLQESSSNFIKKALRLPGKYGRRLYRWTLRWAKTKYALLALFLLAFAESSFFPIPPDVLLLALVVAKPRNFFKLAFLTTIGSVLGAILGYFIGLAFFETVGNQLVQIYHLEEEIAYVGSIFEQNAFWAILISSFTPIPYKVFTISAGLFKISLPILIIGSILGRGARFYIVAFLTNRFGERIKEFLEKYFDLIGLIILIVVTILFVLSRFI